MGTHPAPFLLFFRSARLLSWSVSSLLYVKFDKKTKTHLSRRKVISTAQLTFINSHSWCTSITFTRMTKLKCVTHNCWLASRGRITVTMVYTVFLAFTEVSHFAAVRAREHLIATLLWVPIRIASLILADYETFLVRWN